MESESKKEVPILSCPGADAPKDGGVTSDDPDFVKRARESFDSVFGKGSFDGIRTGG